MKKQVLTNYTVQCLDQVSNTKGCFIFDVQKWKETGKFFAVSQVYSDLNSFFASKDAERRQSIYEEREL